MFDRSTFIATLAIATAAHADVVALREAPDHTTETTVIVDAPSDEVYALVTDYARWPGVFSDVLSVKVLRGGREDAVVRMKSRAFGRTVTVQFENLAGRVIRFRGIEGPPGGKARGEYVLIPIDDGKRTRVEARLYMDVGGPARLFVSKREVTVMRQAKLSADLNDVLAWFRR